MFQADKMDGPKTAKVDVLNILRTRKLNYEVGFLFYLPPLWEGSFPLA